MKIQTLVTMMVLFSGSVSFAGECRLSKPIPMKGATTPAGIALKNAVMDETPAFEDPKAFTPGISTLVVDMFMVKFNDADTGFVGAHVGIDGIIETIGVANWYDGNFQITGSHTVVNGEDTYTFQEITHWDGTIENGFPRHVKGDAVTQSRIMVSGGMITSVSLTVPVYEHWKNGSPDEVAFTGRNQELCLQSASW